MNPAHPLLRRFEHPLIVDEGQFEWIIYEGSFVMRPAEAEETVVWFSLGRADVGRNLLQSSQGKADFFRWRQIVSRQLFWRWWQLESGEECFLHKSYGLLRSRHGELVRFEYPVPFPGVMQANKEEVELFLQMGKVQGELRKARCWSQGSIQERIRQLLLLEGGTFDEFEALIRGGLVLSGVPQTHFDMRDVMIMPGRVFLRYLEGGQRTHPANPVQPFFNILNEHFHMKRTSEEWRGHDELGDPGYTPYPEYSTFEPSHHEHLEALLVWREFLHDKMSPDEIKDFLKLNSP